MNWLLEEVGTALETFGTVATADPLSALLLVAAGGIFAVVFGLGGALALGALSNAVTGWP
ncbi:MAG: hypothetical protein ACOCP3_01240 [Halodesulfurarchaeum sp.]